MYAALNTKGFRGSLFKAYSQYKAGLESKQRYEKESNKGRREIQDKKERNKKNNGE